ncbi:right-handed parallel beta-helix repeat-containing protein [Arthrobacter sp. Hor0625]|uniref:right-handed parallel beta-helix repeat-containing protein n=1 Tax=Arthrobacter sp. Hor0625 TaxID=3457358 RepID=UPI00403E92C5
MTPLDGAGSNREFVINASHYGVRGDGKTDDRGALLEAANAAVALGYPLAIPAGLTMILGGTLVLPTGLQLYTNGSRFRALSQTGRNPQIRIGSHTTVTGGVYITTLGGVSGSGLCIQGATNVRIDVVDIESAIPGQGSGNVRDNGLNITGSSDVTIDRVRIKNFDYSLFAERVPNLTIRWLEIETYKCGAHFRDASRLRLNGGWIHGASPNSAYAPGHNGVLLESNDAAEEIRIENVAVHDAGEHGFRISGPAQIRNLWLNSCSAINCTGTGFKLLGGLHADGVYNENVFFLNCLAEDCGLVNRNTCGFLIQMAKCVKVVSPIIRNRNKVSSGHSGIRLGGVTHLQITDPDIVRAAQYGIFIDSELGNVSDVKINGANIDQTTGWAVYLSNGQPGGSPNNFHNIEIEATVSITDAKSGGFYAGRGAYTAEGTWTGFNRVVLRFQDTVNQTVAASASSRHFHADIIGNRNTTILFKNGSKWLDTKTGNYLLAKAGTWVTQ